MWKLLLGLSVVGILLAIFLLWEQFFHPSFQPCNINTVVNCNAIISGDVSHALGIPTPLIGLIGYCVIFLSALFKKRKLLLGMVSFGLAFCLWIAYQEFFLLHVVCPVCILCQLDMLTIFILGCIINRK